MLACPEREEVVDLVCKDPFASHSTSKSWVIEFTAPNGLETVEDFFATKRAMGQEPVVKEFAEAMGQAQHDMASTCCTGRRGGFENRWDFRIRESWDDRSDHYPNRDASLCEFLDRA